MNAIVTRQELQELVDRYGEDLESWPLFWRGPAREFIDDCAEARAIIRQARQLRVQLRNLGPMAPACFTDRIVSLAVEIDPPEPDDA